MKRSIIILFLISSMATVGYGFNPMEQTFTKESRGIISSQILKVVKSSQYPFSLYAHDKERVYVSFNKGYQFETVARRKNIYDLYMHGDFIFIASDEGLHVMDVTNEVEEKIYNTQDVPIVSVVENQGNIYLVAGNDLYKKESFSARFIKMKSFSKNEEVTHLYSVNSILFLTTKQALFRMSDNDKFEQVFKVGIKSEEGNGLIADLLYWNDKIILATRRGLYVSTDNGINWEIIKGLNLDYQNISKLSFVPTNERHGRYHGKSSLRGLLIGTYKGLFYYDGYDVMRLYKGLESEVIYDVLADEGSITVATEQGMFNVDLNEEQSVEDYDFEGKELIANQPQIDLVQQWAIDYFDVSPDKVSEWRRLSKKSALLPSVSMGFDGGRDWSRSNSLWGSSSGSVYIGPDDKGRGEDFGWDISLSWDLSDYIWSLDQTTIDNRSKLMVELREDILDQVTRLYFERKRLMIEISMDSIEDFSKNLRLEELTAHLDAYTGGEFSKYLAGD